MKRGHCRSHIFYNVTLQCPLSALLHFYTVLYRSNPNNIVIILTLFFHDNPNTLSTGKCLVRYMYALFLDFLFLGDTPIYILYWPVY